MNKAKNLIADFGESFLSKVKKGDYVQSFGSMPVDPQRASVIGRVKKVEIDEKDGVEYVYIDVDYDILAGEASIPKGARKKVRVPQNGTQAEFSLSGVTDNIKVL